MITSSLYKVTLPCQPSYYPFISCKLGCAEYVQLYIPVYSYVDAAITNFCQQTVFIQTMWLNLAVWCNKMFLRKKKEFCILVTFSFLKHFQDLIILAAVPGLQIRRWCPAYLAIKIHKPPTLRKKGNIYI